MIDPLESITTEDFVKQYLQTPWMARCPGKTGLIWSIVGAHYGMMGAAAGRRLKKEFIELYGEKDADKNTEA